MTQNREVLLADIKKVMETPHGKRVLNHILQISGLDKLSFDPANDRNTHFNEGRKYLGSRIRDLMQDADIGLFFETLKDGLTNGRNSRN